MFTRQSIATKVYEWIGGKKSQDLTVSTPHGNLFFTLRDDMVGKMMQAIWGVYSKSSLIALYHTTAEIYAPVHEIASRVAGAKYLLKKVSNDEVVYDNKEINRLLESPNPLQNFNELLYEMVAYYLVTGENYLFANIPDTLTFNYKNVSTLLNLPPDLVTAREYSNFKILTATAMSDLIKSYNLSYGSQTEEIRPEKVLFTRAVSLYSNDKKIIGRSPLLSAQKNIANLAAVMAARNVIYVKGGILGMFVSKAMDAGGSVSLTPDEKEQVIKDMNTKYGTGEGQSPYMITNQPIDFVKIGMSIKDLEPFTETRADAAAIYAVYNVPHEFMPGNEQGATYENRKQAEIFLYRNVVIPMAERLAQSLTTFLRLGDYGLYLDCSFDNVEALQEDKKQKSEVDWRNNETCRVRFMHGIITLNDWRVVSGLEKIVGGIYDTLLPNMTPEQAQQIEQMLNIQKQNSNANQTQTNGDQ
jgi:phage portal protein BeeE